MEILNGIRVIEVTEWGFVPSCATVLADWGADVIKVEHPERGDSIRGLITSGMIPGAKGVNFFVEQLFRNKKSVGIDFTKAGGEGYQGDFIERYIMPIVYPADLTRTTQIALGLVVVAVNVAVYGWYWRRGMRRDCVGERRT